MSRKRIQEINDELDFWERVRTDPFGNQLLYNDREWELLRELEELNGNIEEID